MKYLQDDSGNSISIPSDVYLFKGVVSFLDFRIKGEYSTDFKIPNDSESRKALGYYSLNQVNKVTQKVFSLYDNGNKLSDGRVFIRSVDQEFDLFFVAGNTNWINQITGSIRDIDFSEFDLDFTAENIHARRTATDGVIFPVIDWAYNYKKLSNNFLVKPIRGISVDSFYDFYPCFYSHTIFEYLFAEYGIKLEGNLLDDPIYKSIGVTPSQLTSAAYSSQVSVISEERMDGVRSFPSVIYDTGVLTKIDFDSGTALFDNANDRLVLPNDYQNAVVNFSVDIVYVGTLYLYKNGASVASTTSSSGSATISGSAGDYLELYILVTGAPRFEDTANVTIFFPNAVSQAGQVIISSTLPDIKQIDFVKYIANRFNCIFEFDELSQTLIVSKLDAIQITDAQDLSDKLIGYSIVPMSGYGERNYLRTAEAAELVNYKQNNLSFGDEVIESDGEGEQDIIRTPLMPCETAQNFNLEWLVSNIPLIRLEDSSEAVPYTSVTDNGGNARFVHASDVFEADQVIRVDGTYQGFIVIQSLTGIQIDPYPTVEYTGNGSGNMYAQKIVFNNAGSREIIIINVDVNDINTGSQIYGTQNIRITDSTGQYPQSNIAWAYFTKPNIGTDLDNFKVGLNYGSVVGSNSISFGDLYHKTLRTIVKGQKVIARFMLSEAQYKNISLSEYLYLRTKDFEGYFLIQGIQGYLNQFTPVELELVYGRENN